MPNPASKATPLAETILSELLQRIYDGRLVPGSPVNELLIAEEFKVSRGPVREAVRRLQGIQLVTREPYLKARVVALTPEAARELFEMRMATVPRNEGTRPTTDVYELYWAHLIRDTTVARSTLPSQEPNCPQTLVGSTPR